MNKNATSLTPEQILQFLQSEGIINVGVVENEMLRKEKLKTLKRYHPYSISKVGNRWQTFVHDESKNNHRRKVAKTNKDDLLDWLLVHYGLQTQEALKRSITIESLYPEWLAFKALHVSESYIPRIKGDWKKFYEGTDIVSVPINSLTKIQLDTWVHTIIKEHELTKNAYFNMSIIMRQILDYAVDMEIVNDNLFRKVRVDGRRVFRRVPKKASATQVFSDNEVRELFKLAMYDYRNARLKAELAPLAVIFQFQTGLRISEVCAIRYEDIEGDKLHVQRMYQRDTRKVIDRTKGTFEDRYVYLTPEAKKTIALAKKRQWERQVSADGFIFSLTNDACSYRTVSDCYRRYSARLGLPVIKSSHKARKTFISAAIDSGINLDTVRRVVGHRDEQTTLNSYLYDRTEEKEQCKKFEKVVDRIQIG